RHLAARAAASGASTSQASAPSPALAPKRARSNLSSANPSSTHLSPASASDAAAPPSQVALNRCAPAFETPAAPQVAKPIRVAPQRAIRSANTSWRLPMCGSATGNPSSRAQNSSELDASEVLTAMSITARGAAGASVPPDSSSSVIPISYGAKPETAVPSRIAGGLEEFGGGGAGDVRLDIGRLLRFADGDT